ncbi:MAG: hypothetical protein HQL30_03470 [Candidatus Omnitrophica bacterium]|nr:hypothetical protein [Candidatus Omnitrophota bacterium]
MDYKSTITKIVMNAVDEIHKAFPRKRSIPKDLDGVLYGKRGNIDSLGLVHLIAAVQNEVAGEYGVEIVIGSERAILEQISPFSTLGRFIDFVVLLVEEQKNGNCQA